MSHPKTTDRGGPPNYYYETCQRCSRKKGFSQRPYCNTCARVPPIFGVRRNEIIVELSSQGVSTSVLAKAFALTQQAIMKIIRQY